MGNLSNENEFMSLPVLSSVKEVRTFNSYYPIIMFDGEYDHSLKMTCGKSIRLDPLPSMDAALQAAKSACISTPNAIGFTVRGVENV